MDEDQEFERIRAAIERAANIVGDAMEKEGGHRWDYLIVAVPIAQQSTRVGMMSSVMPEGLPHFLKFLNAAFNRSAESGHVLDDRRPQAPPS